MQRPRRTTILCLRKVRWPVHQIEELKPPHGETLVLKARASGVQIYTCSAGENGERSWTLKAPEADLEDGQGNVIGSHFGGPTWKHRDGSEITAKPATRVDSPDPLAIPWLLLTVTGRSRDGVFSRVTTIQRINTTGGRAPTTPCTGNAEVRVPYTAEYYFYAPVV
jgi:Protein of unknown function (DUF3455)